MAEMNGTPLRPVLDPRTPLRLGLRALDDLHALARVARRDPHPVDEVREELREARRSIAALDEQAGRVEDRAAEIVDGGAELTEVARGLHDLLAGLSLTLTSGLRSIDSLEDSVETVAAPVEPLQSAPRGVGRVTRRLRRDGD